MVPHNICVQLSNDMSFFFIELSQKYYSCPIMPFSIFVEKYLIWKAHYNQRIIPSLMQNQRNFYFKIMSYKSDIFLILLTESFPCVINNLVYIMNVPLKFLNTLYFFQWKAITRIQPIDTWFQLLSNVFFYLW